MVAIRPLGMVLLILVFLSHHTLLRGFFVLFCFSLHLPVVLGQPSLDTFLFCFGFFCSPRLGTEPALLSHLALVFSVHPLSSGPQCNCSSTQQSDTFFWVFIILQVNITPWSFQVMLVGYVESWCNPHVFAAHNQTKLTNPSRGTF